MGVALRFLSVCLTLLALWCAGGAPSYASAPPVHDPASLSGPLHAGPHAAHAAPDAPHDAPGGHRHADCAMTASHCAAMEPPTVVFLGAQTIGQVVHARLASLRPPSRAPAADPPPPSA
ncbi:MAG: hypothetical protein VYD87_07210 [Pseudomonadota bacterium]|nr:hypothetical protein [Pseudomonadota bacterium]MEE3101340.1 hypothetical protein [Pseudomonadota bacterium]